MYTRGAASLTGRLAAANPFRGVSFAAGTDHVNSLSDDAQPYPLVRLQGLKKSYDGASFAVDDLDLTVMRGEFLTLLGPSGSGKTTTLMMLAGFEQPNAGTISFDGRSIHDLPPHRRDFGMVFQNYALFPHLSVMDNIAFPLSVRHLPKAEVRRKVAHVLDMVQLGGLERRFPAQLSGGQQQRVALARALVFEPRLVLMDEPLGALDKRLREQMQSEIKRLHRKLGLTIVYVTHDQTEAMAMSDRVAVFHRGRIRQLDTPRSIHEEPANGFIAQFVGETNSAHGTVEAIENGCVRLQIESGPSILGTSRSPVRVGERRLMSIRPERIRIAPPASHENAFEAVVEDTTYLGDRLIVAVRLETGLPIHLDLGIDGLDNVPARRTPVTIGWSAKHCLILDSE
jgi:putative spermidine/putrescine transport system ATP-binding protein